MIKIVYIILTVWNADAGVLLEQIEGPSVAFSVSGNLIEDCRIAGVARGLRLTDKWRARGYPNATTNVNCFWKEVEGESL